MSYRWIACLSALALVGVASAQEPLETRATFKGFAEVKGVDGPTYKIELLIVEGDVPGFDQAKTDPRDLPQLRLTDEWVKSPTPVPAAAADPDAALAATRSVLPHPIPEPATKTSPAPLLDLVPAGPHVNVLAAPQLAVIAGEEATVQVASRATFEYLEPAGDETFRLRRSEPCELGILLKVTVAPAEDDPEAVVISPLQIEVTSLDGREPVKGIGLEVGKPIVSSRSLKTTVRAPLGEERIVAIPSGPDREAGLILRVTRMEFEEEREPKRSSSGEKDPLKLESTPAR